MNFSHEPVLAAECLEYLNITPGCRCVVDCTVGGAGHASRIIMKLASLGGEERLASDGAAEGTGNAAGQGPASGAAGQSAAGGCEWRRGSGHETPEAARFIGIDRDAEAVEAAKQRIASLRCESVKCDIVHGNFANIEKICRELGVAGAADAILLDIGASSHQLDESRRGFSYQKDSALDMRMDQGQGLSAADIVNEYPQERLAEIIRAYGEERWAARIAAFIADSRKRKPIATTQELADVIKAAIPKAARRDGPHPAKRTFQALRIEVNDELGALSAAIGQCAGMLREGGRLCIISFHSLEDRIVKNAFRDLATGCICPKDLPVCVCGQKPRMRIVTKRPIIPCGAEIESNPRARSAKLRVAEKLRQQSAGNLDFGGSAFGK
ncbi:MAG: 16S rRNA (cytosine(1402)-N(4))-methyltransferase RsmH [Clostridiales bacterium]|jgi:16S rRNA (cytosine1402-N4)-methyltransferase|nr:16S rRNA (cytosine(1402)-N(4))-methyltransferase RsmH [Clostridiales bacterium]